MIWNYKYFKEEEFFLPFSMDEDLLHQLEAFRHEIDTPIIVLNSNMPKEKEEYLYGSTQHGENSLHYENKAVDVMLPLSTKCLFDQFITASRFFSGIGVYPDWSHSEFKRIGGFHLEYEPVHRVKYWIGIKEKGKKVYYALDRKNLTRVQII